MEKASLKFLIGKISECLVLVEYSEMMGRAREIATQRMVQEAESLGADAIINIRFVTTSVGTSASELLAYGTAVKFSNPAA